MDPFTVHSTIPPFIQSLPFTQSFQHSYNYRNNTFNQYIRSTLLHSFNHSYIRSLTLTFIQSVCHRFNYSAFYSIIPPLINFALFQFLLFCLLLYFRLPRTFRTFKTMSDLITEATQSIRVKTEPTSDSGSEESSEGAAYPDPMWIQFFKTKCKQLR